MKRFVSILFCILVLGCTSGSTKILDGAEPVEAVSPETVELLVDEPQRSYKKIAQVTASAKIDAREIGYRYSVTKPAAVAALSRLRKQAAKVGADGILNICREERCGGYVIMAEPWRKGTAKPNCNTSSKVLPAAGKKPIACRSEEIAYVGDAIVFTDEAD